MQTWKEFITWEKASKETIDFKTLYVDIVGKRGVVGNKTNSKGEIENGDIVSGLFLSQIIYWYLPSKSGNTDTKLRVKKLGHLWIVKKPEEWYEEIRLTPANYRTAMKRLEAENLVIKKSMKDPFDENGQKNVTHIRLNIPEFMKRWMLIMKHNEDQLQEIDSEMNEYYEQQMAEALSHMENVESTISKENVKSTISKQNVESTISKENVESTISFITESTPETKTENTNKESIYQEEIKELEVPAPIKRVVQKHLKQIDRLIRENKMSLLEIELTFNTSKLNANDFAEKLHDVLDKGVTISFKGCMKKAVEKFIASSNEKAAANKEQKIVRKEVMPERYKQPEEAPKQQQEVDPDFEEEKRKLKEELLALDAELKNKGKEQPA